VAAFPGCAEDTEASSGTVARLIDYVKDSSAPVILKLELSSGSLADTIAEETGAKVLTLHSAHNVTKADFDSGLSYTDIMEQNINVLKEALQ
ncbi:zinc ABC transporter substrate-binding protein, partial [Candidatus Saccharibacteria bacterium]|nr:zinc ABC transporter substrate-binding protein [Candidatus Saccharibacteria bacterium]